MKVIIAGSRECEDYELLKIAIQNAQDEGIIIKEVVSGGSRGVDKLGEKYAKEHNLNLVIFEAKWKDLTHPEARIKERFNPFSKKKEKHDSMAGFRRNKQMAEYADALIAIDLGTNGTKDMIEQAKKHNLKIYIYEPSQLEEELEGKYQF